MRRFFLVTVVALFALTYSVARAHDADGNHTMTGVLIDNACGGKQKDEAAAKAHTPKCSLKDACAASGYQLIVGEKHIKLNDAGNVKAKAYLEKAEGSQVTIVGRVEDDKLEVASIKAAAAQKPEPKEPK